MASDLQRLKAACARLVGAGSRGTGYVVAKDRIATCWHVVKDWAADERHEAFIGPQQARHEAWLLRSDEAHDAAVVAFEGPLGTDPLPLATPLADRVCCEGYGYPQVAKLAGIPFDAEILDPDAVDQDNRPALQLFSRMVAAGTASPLHGFSGSPLLVGGAVVGHLTRHLGDPDDLTRAAYGVVYACPVSAVRALLDRPPATRETAAPAPVATRLGDFILPVPSDHYHVFVSHRSTDLAQARALAARLEGAGYRVFYDQAEIKPGDVLVQAIESGLQRSRAAIVLVSRAWLGSPWCQEEGSYLVKRAVEDPSFRLIPVRLDDCDMPPLLGSRLWIDLDGVAIDGRSWIDAGGEIRRSQATETIDKLLWAVIGRHPPEPASPERRLLDAESDATQEFVSRIQAARSTGPGRVLDVYEEWRRAGLQNEAPALLAAESLVAQARPDAALEVLGRIREPGLRAQQLLALALRKSGRTEEATEILERLMARGELDPETVGILAGSYKRRWADSGDPAALVRATGLYREGWERTGSPYVGINAAATSLWSGDAGLARDTAVLVRQKIEAIAAGRRDHWDWATLGEAQLLSGRLAEAREAYRHAVQKAFGLHQDIAVMRIQARRNLKVLALDQTSLDSTLPVPRVVAFFGHMVDAAGRPVRRFPAAKVGAVRKAIRSRLQPLGVVHGFSSAARGSDILFLEELLDQGGHATVLLPYPEEGYRRTSLGGDWDRRFDALRASPDKRLTIEVLTPESPPDERLGEVLFATNVEVQKRTRQYARLLGEEPIVIAVWDGKPGDGPGGTADSAALWQADGFDVDVIDVTRL